MRQFDVYPNPSSRSRAKAPYVVVVQSHHLVAAPTVLVAPLLLNDGRSGYTEISALVEFRGAHYIAQIGELGAIDPALLRNRAGDVREYEDAIRRAIDRLLTGF
ncbi:hypothetical protein BH11PSE1_BH11PSE1_27260 [soil metagenome]